MLRRTECTALLAHDILRAEESCVLRNLARRASTNMTKIMPLNETKYESEMQVRPDDIDMNRHVHSSRYLDYVLAARYDQMARCYGMPMEEYLAHGFSWVMTAAAIAYKRPLGLGDRFIVRTWLEEIAGSMARIGFEIVRHGTGKLAASGSSEYVLIAADTGRAVAIPAWILEKYSV